MSLEFGDYMKGFCNFFTDRVEGLFWIVGNFGIHDILRLLPDSSFNIVVVIFNGRFIGFVQQSR